MILATQIQYIHTVTLTQAPSWHSRNKSGTTRVASQLPSGTPSGRIAALSARGHLSLPPRVRNTSFSALPFGGNKRCAVAGANKQRPEIRAAVHTSIRMLYKYPFQLACQTMNPCCYTSYYGSEYQSGRPGDPEQNTLLYAREYGHVSGLGLFA